MQAHWRVFLLCYVYKKSIQPDKMQAISIHFPELNPLWLLLGQGEMLLSDGKKEGEQRQNTGGLPSSELLAKLLEEANSEKARLLSIIESQQRTIESLTELNKKPMPRRWNVLDVQMPFSIWS